VLWSSNSGQSIRKERSLFAENGCLFSDAKFSADERQVGTLFRDGNLVVWELEGVNGLSTRQQDSKLFKFQFPSAEVKLFDFGANMIVGSGPQFPHLVVKRNLIAGNTDFTLYKLPREARGIEQLCFLADRLLLGYLSEGIFHLVDLGQQAPDNKLQIALEIRVPGSLIKRFAVDAQMNALALVASNGHVLLYNLPAAIQND